MTCSRLDIAKLHVIVQVLLILQVVVIYDSYKRLHCYCICASQPMALQKVACTQKWTKNFVPGILWPCTAVPGHSLIQSAPALKLWQTQNDMTVPATSETVLYIKVKMQSHIKELISYVNNFTTMPRLKVCNKKSRSYCNVKIKKKIRKNLENKWLLTLLELPALIPTGILL